MRNATAAEKEQCEAFIRDNEYATVATVAANNTPAAAYVTYMVDENLQIYFFTRESTEKHHNLKENPHVALVIASEATPTTAQINGQAEPLDEKAAEKWMVHFMTERDGFYSTLFKLFGLDFVGYRITPERIRWLHIPAATETEELVEVLP